MMKTAASSVFGLFMLLLATSPAFAEGAQERIDALSQQIANDPNNQQLYHERGRAYYELGRYAEAHADLKKNCSLETNPDAKELCAMEANEVADTYGLPR